MTTDAQRKAALDIGNSRRYANAAWRKELRAMSSTDSRLAAAGMFRNPTKDGQHMKARYAIESVKRFGPARMGKLIRKAGLQPGRLDRKICDLTERERNLIADHLTDPNREDLSAPVFSEAELRLIAQMAEVERQFSPELSGTLGRIASKCGAAA